MKKVVLTLYNFYGCKTDPSHCRRMASDPAMIPRTYRAKPSFAPPSDPYECVPTPTGEAILEEDRLPSRRRHLILRSPPPGEVGPYLSACSCFSSRAGLALRLHS